VTDANGCTGSDVAFNYIQSNAGPTADFGAIGPTASCTAPLTVSFVNSSTGTGNLTYLWDFGDTTTSTAVSPTHTYSSLGIRTVTLFVTDQDGCSDSISIPAFVTIAPVDAQFSVPSVVCPGDPLTFVNNSVGASNFNWNFGDGTSSQAANPGKVYNTPGTYVVTLNASSGSCNDTFTDTITVDLVDADYTASPAYGCAIPHLVNYTDNSSGNIVQWDWSFANGTGSGQQNPLAVYNSPGTFFDTLVVTTASGCTDIVVKPISIFLVNVDFDMDTTRGCAPLTVNFTDLSSPQDSIASWIWDFGDGDSSTLQNPSHTFLTDGIFTVTLSVVTVSGCTLNTSYDVRAGLHNVPNFTVNPTMGCAHDVFTFDNLSTDTNVIDSYIWQFGDGMSSTKFEPGHVYIDTGYMDVSLIVGHLGCFDTLVLDSLLYAQGPVVYFQPVTDCQTPLDVQFNSTLIDATSWQWDFGDGSPIDSTSANPLHTYPNQGAYTVKLTAQNANNGCDYDTLETVFLLPVLAEFTIDDADGCVPHTVNLNAFGSLNAVHTEWDFGNGSPTVQDTFITSYTYTSAGTYPIRLVVEGGDGCRDTLIKNVVVSQPVADFSVPDTVGCAPFAVQFTDLSTADTTIVSWAWSLGNGSGSTAQNPSTVYPLIGNGVFTVSLRVTDINGCSDTLVRQNYISVQSTPIDFQATSPVCEGDTVFFSNVPGGPGSTYFWQFGDGQTDTAQLPAHVYQTLGFHNVTLTITDSIGCDTTLTKNSFVQIQPIPVAAFTANPRDSSCFPMAVTFTDTGGLQLIQQRIWDFGDGSAPITVLGAANNVVVHTYTAPGKYDVSLIKRTDAGCADTLLQPEYIEVGGPLATFTIDADTVCKGEPVTFTVTSQVNVLNFFWDFGDGQDTLVPATTTTVQHVYQQTGPLIPQLIFWDSAGVCPKFADTAILIDEVVAGFNLAGDTAGCVPFSLALTDLSLGASGWSWNFGNGAGSSLHTAQVTYAQAGNYQLSLVARDTITQCSDSVAVSVQAYATPVVTVSTDSFICEGDTMPLLATGGVSYQWSPANGLSDPAIPNPIAYPDSTQPYAVLVTDANGCTATGTTVVGVQPFPSFEGPLLNRDTTIFIGQIVELVTTASELLTYTWSPPTGLSCTTCPAPVAAPGEDVIY
ncbi:MAG: PKD domain-containing protein, partial [Bacteroidota bacterium]